PCDYSQYHPDWKSIRRQILDQADHRCEQCGVANGAIGARDRHGAWHDEADIDGMNSGTGERLFGEYPHMIRIVLTIAHLCHDPACYDPGHIFAYCQRCHLNWDRERHLRNAAITRQRNREAAIAATGQRRML
ncbi:MAG: hypothetical protein AB7U18_16280, partial [Dehalococcoidia bacterium]